MKIGVFGSSSNDISEQIRINARRIGAEIARTGNTLVTGATAGVSHEAVNGARDAGGKAIGFSPAISLEEHVRNFNCPAEGFSDMIFIPKDFAHAKHPSMAAKLRSIMAISHCDIVIIVGGRTGTMTEFAIAYDGGKNIGILEGSGGITERAIDTLLEDIDKKRGAKIVRTRDPVELIRKLIEVDEQDKHITF